MESNTGDGCIVHDLASHLGKRKIPNDGLTLCGSGDNVTGAVATSDVDELDAFDGPNPRDLLEGEQTMPWQVPQLHNRMLTPSLANAGRPTTAQTEDLQRPFTASSYHRSKLVTADGSVGNYICAILENRGTGREVGIASIERETGETNNFHKLLV